MDSKSPPPTRALCKVTPRLRAPSAKPRESCFRSPRLSPRRGTLLKCNFKLGFDLVSRKNSWPAARGREKKDRSGGGEGRLGFHDPPRSGKGIPTRGTWAAVHPGTVRPRRGSSCYSLLGLGRHLWPFIGSEDKTAPATKDRKCLRLAQDSKRSEVAAKSFS